MGTRQVSHRSLAQSGDWCSVYAIKGLKAVTGGGSGHGIAATQTKRNFD